MFRSGWDNVWYRFSAHVACVQTHPLAHAHLGITCAFWRVSPRLSVFILQLMMFHDIGVRWQTKLVHQCSSCWFLSLHSSTSCLCHMGHQTSRLVHALKLSQGLLLDPHWARDPVWSCTGASAEAMEWSRAWVPSASFMAKASVSWSCIWSCHTSAPTPLGH